MNVNTNITHLSGIDITESVNEKYKEYRNKWNEYPKTFTVAEFPLFLDIEATSVCNLRCPTCIQTHTHFKKGYMGIEMYKGVIDEGAERGLYGCKYHTIGRGEPLLYKQLPEMVAYAKSKGLIDVYVNTNAVLLDVVKSWELLHAGLDRISFSVDYYDPVKYEKFRPGANFDIVRSNIIRFKVIRDSFNFNTKIRIQTIGVFGLDLEKYSDFWKDYCDEVSVITYKDMTSRTYNIESDWTCPQLWQRMSILFDGTILPCNHDDRELAMLGEFPFISIEKAWNSVYMAKMRSKHFQGKSYEIPACDGCFLRSSEISNRKGGQA